MTCNCTGACKRPPYTCGGSPYLPWANVYPSFWPTPPIPTVTPNPQFGWQCPSCRTIYSPYIQTCTSVNCNRTYWGSPIASQPDY